MIKTFVGYSTDGLDIAVKDCYKDLEKFMNLDTTKALELEPRPINTTSNAVNLGGPDMQTQYWFTLTVVID